MYKKKLFYLENKTKRFHWVYRKMRASAISHMELVGLMEQVRIPNINIFIFVCERLYVCVLGRYLVFFCFFPTVALSVLEDESLWFLSSGGGWHWGFECGHPPFY